MDIELITPHPPDRVHGNIVTARRVATLLEELGHRISISNHYQGRRCDLLVALHALHSHESIRLFREINPDKPIILMLTGTDLYNFIQIEPKAVRSLEMATRLVVLQRMGLVELPE